MRAVVACLALIAGLGLVRVDADGNASVEQQENSRLRAHFDSVVAELRAARVEHLSISQLQARSTLIDMLREYRDAGRFPRNDRFTLPTPFFRDASGTLCAMAYLVARSGRTDIVDRIASSANNAYIHDLRTDEGLVLWADSTGLSLAEAARVQPEYEFLHKGPPGALYVASTIAVSGLAVASSGHNVFAPSRASGWWGVLTGMSAVVLGLSKSEAGSKGDWARTNVAIGVTSIALSVRGFRHKDPVTASAGRQTPDAPRQRSLTLAPIVALGGERATIGFGASF